MAEYSFLHDTQYTEIMAAIENAVHIAEAAESLAMHASQAAAQASLNASQALEEASDAKAIAVELESGVQTAIQVANSAKENADNADAKAEQAYNLGDQGRSMAQTALMALPNKQDKLTLGKGLGFDMDGNLIVEFQNLSANDTVTGNMGGRQSIEIDVGVPDGWVLCGIRQATFGNVTNNARPVLRGVSTVGNGTRVQIQWDETSGQTSGKFSMTVTTTALLMKLT